MSKFSINDRVSFINEKQDGVIKSFKTDGICVVEIEDGFEIDALEKELVLIQHTNVKSVTPPLPNEKPETIIPEFLKNIPALTYGTWLVSCPAESGMVLTGTANFYIVNNVDYDILIAVSLRSGKKLKGVIATNILQGAELLIRNIKRADAIDIESWHIQIIFHKQNEFEAHSTVTKEIPVSFPDITSANSLLKAPYAFCKLDFIAGATSMEIETEEGSSLFSKYSVKDIQDAIGKNAGKQAKNEKLLAKPTASQFVVDLHIEELVETIDGLSNAEIVAIQLNHFRQKLDEALYKKAYKIIFIHGVGNGKLKSAIRSELQSHNIEFTDGAYERFGGGATEVIL